MKFFCLRKVGFLFPIWLLVSSILCPVAAAASQPNPERGPDWFVEMGKLFYDMDWDKTWQRIEGDAKQNNQILIPIFDGLARVMAARVNINDQSQLRAIGMINSKYWAEVSDRWQTTGKPWKAIARFFENSQEKLSPLLVSRQPSKVG